MSVDVIGETVIWRGVGAGKAAGSKGGKVVEICVSCS